MSKVIISTVVDSKYQYYIPLFLYCLRKEYPEYSPVIYTHRIKSSFLMDMVMKGFFNEKPYICFDDFGMVGDPAFDEVYPDTEHDAIAYRFLIGKKLLGRFTNMKYTYITDIDMMILRESPTLEQFHLKEMAKTGLCYSNSIRNKKHWEGINSLTGLHFASREWFEKVEKSAQAFREILKGSARGQRREYDGWMLYRMCADSKTGLPGKYLLAGRHHGIHLGNFRLFKKAAKLNKRMPQWMCYKWKVFQQDPKFQKICKFASQDPMIKEQLDQLETHIKRLV